MTGWQAAHIGLEGDGFKIDTLEIWRHEWRLTGAPHLTLPHPAYPDQIHRYAIYEIENAGVALRFAASELSNGVWGFYIPGKPEGS
jgi:hypothetical protein